MSCLCGNLLVLALFFNPSILCSLPNKKKDVVVYSDMYYSQFNSSPKPYLSLVLSAFLLLKKLVAQNGGVSNGSAENNKILCPFLDYSVR